MTASSAMPAASSTRRLMNTQDAGRVRTAVWCAGTASALGAGAVGLLAQYAIEGHPVALFILSGAALLACAVFVLLSFITASTRTAVADVSHETANQVDRVGDRISRSIKEEICGEFAHLVRGTALGARRADDTIPLLRPITDVPSHHTAYGWVPAAAVNLQHVQLLKAFDALGGRMETAIADARWQGYASALGDQEYGSVTPIRPKHGRIEWPQ